MPRGYLERNGGGGGLGQPLQRRLERYGVQDGDRERVREMT